MSTPCGITEDDLEFLVSLLDDPLTREGLEDASSANTTKPAVGPSRGARRRRRSGSGNGDTASGTSSSSSGWLEIAKRQKQQRTEAERENAKLRALVDAHVRTTRKFLKLTQKAALLAKRHGIVFPNPCVDMLYLGPPSNDITRVVAELDALSREAESVITTSTGLSTELQVLGMQNQIVRTATGTATEATLEVAWVLPFGVDVITNTLLADSVRLLAKKEHQGVTTLLETSKLKVVQAMTQAKEKKGLQLSKHGRVATRCEPRRDGSTLLLMVAKGGLIVDTELAVSVDVDSCILVQPVPGHDASALGPLSRIQWYRRFRSQPSENGSLSVQDRARWLHSVSSKAARRAHRQVDKVTQAMENLLLTASLRA